MSETIGRGTWLDKLASRIVDREAKLGRSLTLIRVESGLGASGIPHIGSLGDAVRAYGVMMALEDLGYRSEFIAFSDDFDGLRKVPAGLPEHLNKYIATPVLFIPDPFGCHNSYGEHMSWILLDALNKLDVKYRFQSGARAYRDGLLNKEIIILLENSQRIGVMIAEMLGQKKFEDVLPYFPICEKCGRIYVAEAYRYLKDERKVLYRCRGTTIGRKWVKGCGHEGEVDVTAGRGKLSWKVEFAARWRALDVRFEAYGKDIADSVKVNDWVSDGVLGYPHPFHARYEMFLDKSGRKISKSIGNVFTPQTWLRYSGPQPLMLLMFKRMAGTRSLSVEDIPKYVDEYDVLEDVYFGRLKIDNEAKRRMMKGLYEYVNHLKPPSQPNVHIPYRMLIHLASVAPLEDRYAYVEKKLLSYGVVKQITQDMKRRVEQAVNWAEDFKTASIVKIALSEEEKEAVRELAEVLKGESDSVKIQSEIFEIARRHGIKPAEFFRILYRIILGSGTGPRLGTYFIDIGREKAAELLLQQLEG